MEEVTGIFDIGKTNKKLLLFNKSLEVLHEEITNIAETPDEDSVLWDDLDATKKWVEKTFNKFYHSDEYHITRLNFTTFGASLVHLDKNGKPFTPLYSYLKNFPAELKESFFDKYGGEQAMSKTTASPSLGMLNSGLQLYWLKNRRPELFSKIITSLHYPQYFSYLFTGKKLSEKTSIGCHTMLWDFEKNTYHTWVTDQGFTDLLPLPVDCLNSFTATDYPDLLVGTGLHDSSASLIPYLASRTQPFALISTGTWSISLNPFSKDPLTNNLLKADCLNFYSYQGKTVRASRLFTGHVHNEISKKAALYFGQNEEAIFELQPNIPLIDVFISDPFKWQNYQIDAQGNLTPDFKLATFSTLSEAYHHLMFILVSLQKESLQLAIGSSVIQDVLITGGFSKSKIFTKLMASIMPSYHFYTAEIGQATALGAALAVQPNMQNISIGQQANFNRVSCF